MDDGSTVGMGFGRDSGVFKFDSGVFTTSISGVSMGCGGVLVIDVFGVIIGVNSSFFTKKLNPIINATASGSNTSTIINVNHFTIVSNGTLKIFAIYTNVPMSELLLISTSFTDLTDVKLSRVSESFVISCCKSRTSLSYCAICDCEVFIVPFVPAVLLEIRLSSRFSC